LPSSPVDHRCHGLAGDTMLDLDRSMFELRACRAVVVELPHLERCRPGLPSLRPRRHRGYRKTHTSIMIAAPDDRMDRRRRLG